MFESVLALKCFISDPIRQIDAGKYKIVYGCKIFPEQKGFTLRPCLIRNTVCNTSLLYR